LTRSRKKTCCSPSRVAAGEARFAVLERFVRRLPLRDHEVRPPEALADLLGAGVERQPARVRGRVDQSGYLIEANSARIVECRVGQRGRFPHDGKNGFTGLSHLFDEQAVEKELGGARDG
jgi:hypothetical protein